jgi:hypothetical protein
VTFVADGRKTGLRHNGSDKSLPASRGFDRINDVPQYRCGPRTEDLPNIMPPAKRTYTHAPA